MADANINEKLMNIYLSFALGNTLPAELYALKNKM